MKLARLLGPTVLLQVLLAGAADGQDVPARLPNGPAPGIAVTHVLFADEVGSDGLRAITGPTVNVSWLTGSAVGVDAALTYLPPSGFHDLTGAAADIGAAYALPYRRTAFLLRAGLSVTLAGNNDGGYLAGAGGYGGVGVLVRISSRLALRADATARPTAVGEAPTAVSLGAGVTLLP